MYVFRIGMCGVCCVKQRSIFDSIVLLTSTHEIVYCCIYKSDGQPTAVHHFHSRNFFLLSFYNYQFQCPVFRATLEPMKCNHLIVHSRGLIDSLNMRFKPFSYYYDYALSPSMPTVDEFIRQHLLFSH